MSNFDEIINDPHGKKVLMYLVAPRNTKHLQYDLVQLMKTSDALNTRYVSNIREEIFILGLFFFLAKKMRRFVRRNYSIIANRISWIISQEIFFRH